MAGAKCGWIRRDSGLIKRFAWLLVAGVTMPFLASDGALAADLDIAEPAWSGNFTASLTVNEYYTDNVFYTRPQWDEPRLGDWVTVFLPTLNYRLEREGHRINLGGSGEIGRYNTYDSENYEDFRLYSNGTHRLDPVTLAVWGLSIARDHEPRDSIEPSAQIGPVPPVYWRTSSYGAISRRFDDDSVKLGYVFDRYDFVESGGVNYDFRDRNMATVGARWTHRQDDTTSIFGDATADIRDYDSTNSRDSHGVRASLGWQKKYGDTVDLELYAGLIYQNFDNAGFDDVVAADYGGDLSWRPMPGTSVSIKAQRTLEETTLADTSSYLRTAVRLQVQQLIRSDFRVYGGASAAMLDFQGTSREDQLTNAWLGFRKYVSPNLFIGAEAAYEERESNLPLNDYTEARVMGRIGIDTDEAFSEEDLAAAPGIDNTDVYIGIRGGVTSLMTLLDGERQPGQNGRLTADFGNFGLTGDVVGGIGVDIARWYVGLEGDVSLSDARWDHSRLPGGRVFSVKREESVGGALLAGRRLAGGALAYGRAGVRASTFETRYASANSSSTETASRLGFEYGVGTRVPVSDHFSVGMEYVHAVFDDYLMAPGNGEPDAFANSESTARISAAWHFNPIPRSSEAEATHDFAGGYWGLQVGHGGLSSSTTGNRRQEGEPPVTSVLNADFGDTGFSAGLLTGYNMQMGSFVFGGEIDAEFARQEWNHERSPSGRTFSIEKVASGSASVRAGVVLNDAALAYARVGVTGSYFDINFNNSDNGDTASSSDWRAGLRYGGGLEVPVNKDVALRFDYTFTDYGTLSLLTQSGLETYDTRESLFRLGAILKL